MTHMYMLCETKPDDFRGIGTAYMVGTAMQCKAYARWVLRRPFDEFELVPF